MDQIQNNKSKNWLTEMNFKKYTFLMMATGSNKRIIHEKCERKQDKLKMKM